MPRVVRFVLVTVIRRICLGVIVLVINAKSQEIVCWGFTRPVHSDSSPPSNSTRRSLSIPLPPLPISTLIAPRPGERAGLAELTPLAKRFSSYAAQIADSEYEASHTTAVFQFHGFVSNAIVPDRTAGGPFPPSLHTLPK